MRILVTGATGFVGRYLCPVLSARGHLVTAAVRSMPDELIKGTKHTVAVGEVDGETDWSEAVVEQDAVIHLVARTHVMGETDNDQLYYQTNVEGTRALATAAIKAGVGRFIFLSSIKALAEESGQSTLTEDMIPIPEDAYGRTKLEAEQILLKCASGTDMNTTIVRPPLIYGVGAKANLLKLLKACDKGVPLPLGLINNRRSLVSLGNLADALAVLVEAAGVDHEIFHVSDGDAISTTELVRRISFALGRSPRLVPVPVWVLKLAGKMTGKSDTISRLTGSLEMTNDKLRRVVGWTPPYNMIQGLQETAEWFRNLDQPEETTN
jgi:nucleoside-diphosphate-sugar epimerase